MPLYDEFNNELALLMNEAIEAHEKRMEDEDVSDHRLNDFAFIKKCIGEENSYSKGPDDDVPSPIQKYFAIKAYFTHNQHRGHKFPGHSGSALKNDVFKKLDDLMIKFGYEKGLNKTSYRSDFRFYRFLKEQHFTVGEMVKKKLMKKLSTANYIPLLPKEDVTDAPGFSQSQYQYDLPVDSTIYSKMKKNLRKITTKEKSKIKLSKKADALLIAQYQKRIRAYVGQELKKETLDASVKRNLILLQNAFTIENITEHNPSLYELMQIVKRNLPNNIYPILDDVVASENKLPAEIPSEDKNTLERICAVKPDVVLIGEYQKRIRLYVRQELKKETIEDDVRENLTTLKKAFSIDNIDEHKPSLYELMLIVKRIPPTKLYPDLDIIVAANNDLLSEMPSEDINALERMCAAEQTSSIAPSVYGYYMNDDYSHIIADLIQFRILEYKQSKSPQKRENLVLNKLSKITDSNNITQHIPPLRQISYALNELLNLAGLPEDMKTYFSTDNLVVTLKSKHSALAGAVQNEIYSASENLTEDDNPYYNSVLRSYPSIILGKDDTKT